MIGSSRDDRAAAPVIGNLLLVAIAVILGTVVIVFASAFLLGSTDTAPAANYEFEYQPNQGQLTVVHTDGKRLTAGNTWSLAIVVAGSAGSETVSWARADDAGDVADFPIDAGSSLTLDDAHPGATADATLSSRFGEGDTVRVVWTNPQTDESFVLDRFEIPRAATGPSLPSPDVEQGDSIQAAIDAASPGDTIYIESGVAHTESGLITVDKAVTITSTDPANPATVQRAGGSDGVFEITSAGATLESLVVDGRNAGGGDLVVAIAADDTTIRDLTVLRTGTDGDSNLRINGASGVTITDSTVKGGPISGNPGDSAPVTVTDNTVARTLDEGIWFKSSGGETMTITGNDVSDYDNGNSGNVGILVWNATPAALNGETGTQAQATSLVCGNAIDGDTAEVNGAAGNPANCP